MSAVATLIYEIIQGLRARAPDQSAVATLIYEIIQGLRARAPDQPALIGVGGPQGSGKSYLCRLLAQTHLPRYAHLSLDDVYLSPTQRAELARTHRLFVTRGPPGTHDVALAAGTLAKLRDAMAESETPLPRYDKIADAPCPADGWPRFKGRPEAVLFDGWCVGALAPAEIGKPLNPIEVVDSDEVWRETQDQYLKLVYKPLWSRLDAIVYLQAPSWEIVRVWRGEQEAQALGRALTEAENAALDRFVMHYERLTRSMLAGHHLAKWIVHLDEARNVVRVEER